MTVLMLEMRMGFLSLVSPKRRSPAPDDDRVDHQAQLVNQVVLQQRMRELQAGGDNDFPVHLLS